MVIKLPEPQQLTILSHDSEEQVQFQTESSATIGEPDPFTILRRLLFVPSLTIAATE